MRSIRSKILLIILSSGIFSFIFSSILVSISLSLIDEDAINAMSESSFLLAGGIILLIYGVLLLAFFILPTLFLLNKVVVKRIKSLETQTQEVIKGNYDDTININSKDEIGKLANTYKTMLEELQKNEYLSKTFIRDYSHEIKTPLSSINGFATLIEETKDIDKIYRYSELIRYESKRLATMSLDLLQISELDSNVIVRMDDQTNITEMLREIILMTEPIWKSKNLVLDLNFDEITITTNNTLIYTIFLNLVTNAIKYSPIDSMVTISLRKADSIEFIISNIGNIEQTDLEKIYSLFYTTDKNNSKRSSGVGLALVSRIIQKLNSEITCTSVDNNVTFTVKLGK